MGKLLTFLFLLTFAGIVNNSFAQNTGNPNKSVSEAIKTLNGNWEWTESRFASRGVKPTVKTPASTGHHVVVTFKADNTATVYLNKSLQGTYPFTLIQPQGEYLKIAFAADKNGQVSEYLAEGPLYFSGNKMTIAGGYNDAGENVTFRKVSTVKKKATAKKTTK